VVLWSGLGIGRGGWVGQGQMDRVRLVRIAMYMCGWAVSAFVHCLAARRRNPLPSHRVQDEGRHDQAAQQLKNLDRFRARSITAARPPYQTFAVASAILHASTTKQYGPHPQSYPRPS
jgi:hypothetical protein